MGHLVVLNESISHSNLQFIPFLWHIDASSTGTVTIASTHT